MSNLLHLDSPPSLQEVGQPEGLDGFEAGVLVTGVGVRTATGGGGDLARGAMTTWAGGGGRAVETGSDEEQGPQGRLLWVVSVQMPAKL